MDNSWYQHKVLNSILEDGKESNYYTMTDLQRDYPKLTESQANNILNALSDHS